MSNQDHIMTVSRNGQVSIPASARARWRTQKVLVADLGDRVVLRPLPDKDPVASLRGKYAGHGPDTSTLRHDEREADAKREATLQAQQSAHYLSAR